MDLRLFYMDRVILLSLISFVFFSFFSISLTQISCGVGGLAWAVKCFLSRSWERQTFPLKIPFLLFVFACVFGVANAPDISSSYKSLKRLLEILIFFWAVNCIDSEKLKEQLCLLLIAAATLSTLTGFYSAWENGVNSIVLNFSKTRAEGMMSVYMTYAGLLMLSLMVAAGKLFFAPNENKWIYIASILIMACLMLTLARQAWLGVLAGVLFLVWFRKKSLLWLMPLILGLLFLASPQNIQNRIKSFADLTDYNLKVRIALWKGGWSVFKDHPLTGCGFKCIDVVSKDWLFRSYPR